MLVSASLWGSDADEHAGVPLPHLSTAVTHGHSLLLTLIVSLPNLFPCHLIKAQK